MSTSPQRTTDGHTELLPCPVPWCGGNPSQFTQGDYWHVPQPTDGVRCVDCGASAPDVETWNTRTNAHYDLVEALEKAAMRFEAVRARIHKLGVRPGMKALELADYTRQCEAEIDTALAKAREAGQ